jgi:UDP-N-acetylmuramate dehydrogenase
VTAERTRPEVSGAFGELAGVLAARGVAAEVDAPLGALTTYRVGGTAALVVEASREADLLALHESLHSLPAARLRDARPGVVPVLVLGKGSNLVVADAGFGGVVVRLRGELERVDVRAGSTPPVVRAGGGAGLPVVARRSVDEGLRGLEWAVGIPGSVGGALKMNAGGHGSDTAACLVRYRWVDVVGGDAGEAGPDALHLGYRTSTLAASAVVVWAELAATRGDPDAGRRTIREIVRWRLEHQPGGKNAGSVFTNPPGDSAGRLVEAAGLKGFRLRTARVSEKHANFIQADEAGSADDVVALMAHVRRVVAESTGVLLRPEVRIVGFGEHPLDTATVAR